MRRSAAAPALWAGLLALAVACGGEGDDRSAEPGASPEAPGEASGAARPEVPAIDTTEMEPLVQEYLGERLSAVRARPEDGRAWAELGLALDAHMFLEEGEGCLAVALDIDPSNARAAYDYAVLGTFLPREVGDVTARFERATAMMPDYAPGFARLGQHLLANGDPEGAEAAFRRSLEAADDYDYARLGLARALLDRDDVEGALALLEPLQRAYPGDEAIAATLAQALTVDGRIDEATAATERSRQAPPTKLQVRDTLRREIMGMSRTAAMNFQRGEAKLRKGDLRGSAVEFERVLTVDATNRRARLILASTLVQLRDLDGARGHLEALLEQDARDADAHAGLGQIDAESRRFEEAIGHFVVASARGPLDDRSTEAWITVLGELKRWDEVLFRIDEWAQRSPQHPSPPYFRAMALANVGRTDEAQAQLAAAIRAHPRSPMRARIQAMLTPR